MDSLIFPCADGVQQAVLVLLEVFDDVNLRLEDGNTKEAETKEMAVFLGFSPASSYLCGINHY